MLKHINQISEQAFLLDFGSEINIQINKYVISFADCILQEIEKDNHLKIINCVPSYNKILIQFNAFSDTKTKIIDFLHSSITFFLNLISPKLIRKEFYF